MSNDFDLFSLEIIQNSIDAACEEMFSGMRQTAMSTIIYEVLDFGVGITDPEGNLVSQGAGIPIFIGMLEPGVKAICKKFKGADRIFPGDIFITNDPWHGGASHLNDVSLVMPVFSGDTLVAWTANKAHWSDIGGMVPGSVAIEATEVYQEGLQFPDIKLFERGEPIESVIDMIRANSRLPDNTLGDMWAGVASLRLGANRLEQLVTVYGLDVFTEALRRYMDYGEVVSRQALARLPKGTFRTVGDLESLGRFKMLLTITDEHFTIDLRGNRSQVNEPANCPYAVTLCGAKVAFKAITDPGGICNAGVFRPLRLLCDEGSLFAAKRPAPVGLFHEPVMFVTDLVWRSLAEVLPEQLTAGHFGSVGALVIGSIHPDTGKPAFLIEPEVGGFGAGMGYDGANSQFSKIDGETYNTPVELNEARNAVFVRQYRFNEEDGGEGEYRGGKGVVLEYEIKGEDAWTTGLFTPNHTTTPWSINGGKPGSSNRVEILRRDGGEEILGKFSNIPLKQGDIIRVITGAGGGAGDPLRRDRTALESDIRNGYITERQAQQYYGHTAGE